MTRKPEAAVGELRIRRVHAIRVSRGESETVRRKSRSIVSKATGANIRDERPILDVDARRNKLDKKETKPDQHLADPQPHDETRQQRLPRARRPVDVKRPARLHHAGQVSKPCPPHLSKVLKITISAVPPLMW